MKRCILSICGSGGVTNRASITNSDNIQETSPVCDNNAFNEFEKPTERVFRSKANIGKLKLHLWDTAGRDLKQGSLCLYTKKADVIFLVYDICNELSFNSLKSAAQSIINNGTRFRLGIVYLY